MRRQVASMGPLGGFAHQVFELGEHLLDRVEVWAVRRQEQEPGAGRRIAARIALPLWLPRLSMMTMSPAFKVGARNCST